MWLHPSDLCHCSRQQITCWWRRGEWWTEADGKERSGNCNMLCFYLFRICSGGPPRSFHIRQTEKSHCRVQNMFGCFLFLSCLPSLPAPPSSCHENPGKHTHTHSHSHTNILKELVAMHITWVLHLWRPLCFFPFWSLQQRWWGGSHILHLRAVSTQKQKLLFKTSVCNSVISLCSAQEIKVIQANWCATVTSILWPRFVLWLFDWI